MQDKKWLYLFCLAEIGTMMVLLNYAAVLPIIMEEWALTNTEAGMIYSAYQVGYICLVVLLSTLTDYVDTKIIYVSSALWAGLCGIAFALFAHDFQSALIIRLLTGFGLAGTYMPGMKIVSARFKPEMRGWALGIYVGAFSIGTALPLLFSGLITGFFSWRTAVFITSLGPVAGAFIALAILKSLPPAYSPGREKGFGAVIKNKPALLVMAGYAGHMWEMFGMRGWIVVFIAAALVSRNYGMAEATSYGSLLAAFVIAAGGFSTALAGRLSDRYGRIRTIQIIMFSSAACSFIFGWTRPLPILIIVIISMVYGLLVTAESSVLSTTITEMVPYQSLGSGMAMQSLLGWAIAAVSPVVFGIVLDLTNSPELVKTLGYTPNWGPAFMVLGLGAVFGIAAVSLAGRLAQSNGE